MKEAPVGGRVRIVEGEGSQIVVFYTPISLTTVTAIDANVLSESFESMNEQRVRSLVDSHAFDVLSPVDTSTSLVLGYLDSGIKIAHVDRTTLGVGTIAHAGEGTDVRLADDGATTGGVLFYGAEESLKLALFHTETLNCLAGDALINCQQQPAIGDVHRFSAPDFGYSGGRWLVTYASGLDLLFRALSAEGEIVGSFDTSSTINGQQGSLAVNANGRILFTRHEIGDSFVVPFGCF